MAVTDEPLLYEDENGDSAPIPGTSTQQTREQRMRVVVKEGTVSIVEEGSSFHLPSSATTVVSGTPLTVLSSTVPASTTRKITNVRVTTRASGKFEIKVGSTVIGSGRTGPANMNVAVEFLPSRAALTTEVITVDFTMLHGKIGQDIEVYLMANDT
ncbi:MAG: hypothetical protein GY861_17915 [bacterium]|nr:hypothetical protein [bacterium]